jgi:hypothetical protein
VNQQQRDALDQLLQDAPLDLGRDVAEQRVIFEDMMAAIPVPADVTTSSRSLGGIPVVNVEAAGADHATGLAARASAADVAVKLEVTPGVPHVFQGFAAISTKATLP